MTSEINRKGKKSIEKIANGRGRAYVTATFNNTLVTITSAACAIYLIALFAFTFVFVLANLLA